MALATIVPSVGELCQPRLVAEVEVGRHERWRVAAEALDEVGEHVGAEVELVVADRERVEADLVEREGVVEGHALVETRLELRAGEEVVARRQQDHAAVRRLPGRSGASPCRIRPQLRRRASAKRAIPPKCGVAGAAEQLRLAVVVMQDRQRERGLGIMS